MRLTRLIATLGAIAALATVPEATHARALPGVPAGRVYTATGSLVPTSPLRTGALATTAFAEFPDAILERRNGDLLVALDLPGRILRIGPGGRIRKLAGHGRPRGGPGGSVSFGDDIVDMAEMPDGSLLVAAGRQAIVWRVAQDGTARIAAGRHSSGSFSGDGGRATRAELSAAAGVAVLPDGGFLVADIWNNRVRKVSRDGIITTVAGTGRDGHTGDGGPATRAAVHRPVAVAAQPDGGFLIAEANADLDMDGAPDTELDRHARVRRVSPNGVIHTVTELPAVSLVSTGRRAFVAAVDREGLRDIDVQSAPEIVHVSRHGRKTVVAGSPRSVPIFASFSELVGAAPGRTTDVWTSEIARAHDGGLYFADVRDRVRYWAPAHPARLAIGITPPTVRSSLRLRATFRLTRPALVAATARGLDGTVRHARGRFRAGAHELRLGAPVHPGSYDIRLTAVSAHARPHRVSDVVRVRPAGLLTIPAAQQALAGDDAWSWDIGVEQETHGCRQMSDRRVDCPIINDDVCQHLSSVVLRDDGTIEGRDYTNADCAIQAQPSWYAGHPIVP